MQHNLLQLHKDTTIISTPSNKFDLAIGYAKLAKQYFNQPLPTPYQVEMAIIEIEDAISLIHHQWQADDSRQITFYCKDQWLQTIAILLNISTGDISREHIETLFNRVADVIAGSPKYSHDCPDSLEFISQLLIVRELMHHLDIKQLQLA